MKKENSGKKTFKSIKCYSNGCYAFCNFYMVDKFGWKKQIVGRQFSNPLMLVQMA